MEKYIPLLNEFDTQSAIALVKDKFASELCDSLDLSRVSAPLFVKQGSGINDVLKDPFPLIYSKQVKWQKLFTALPNGSEWHF